MPDGRGIEVEGRSQARRGTASSEEARVADALSLLLESLDDVALVGLDPGGHVEVWSEGARRLTGREPKTVVGRHLSAVYAPDETGSGQAEQDLQAAAAGDAHRVQRRWAMADGSALTLDLRIRPLRDAPGGRLRGFSAVARRAQTVDAGASSQEVETLRLLVSNVVDYAIFALDPEGRVATWNEGARRLKQYEPHEIVGSHFSTFYLPADRAAGKPQRLLDEAVRNGRVEDEGWRVRKDGTRFWADVVITALRSADGTLRGFAKVTRDLTERRQAEEALRSIAERERETAEQLREVDRSRQSLVAIVAHDLRTPVGVIHGTADMLVQDWDRMDDAGRLHLIRALLASSARLHALADDILDLSRIETGRLRYEVGTVDLLVTVERAARDVDPELRRVVITPPPGGRVLVRGDERRVWQIVTNLLSNALKFSPPVEPVVVVIEEVGDTARISVTDNGIGIADEDRPRLFQPFSRIPDRSGSARETGTGLGLYIARSLARDQGGDVTVDSVAGAGATFSVTLPLARGASSAEG